MTKPPDSDEIIIDFKKVLKTIVYRKVLIIGIVLLIMLASVALTFILPRKYTSEAEIYIDIANTTNLADINPFFISTIVERGGMANLLRGRTSGLSNEIEIIKSPLVLENVIKENSIKYKKGRKKGEYISVNDFMAKHISIFDKKGTNIISITYKSQNAGLAYNIVNSIINNYQRVNEEINLKKARSDRQFLETSYLEAKVTIENKLEKFKQRGILPSTGINLIETYGMAGYYNLAISDTLKKMARQSLEIQKDKLLLDQEIEKLKMLKNKLEWATLVEEMSKTASNIIILKHPDLKRDFDHSEPKLLINMIIGGILSLFGVMAGLICRETTDKKLTFFSLGEKVIYNLKENIDSLKMIFMSNQNKKISLITFNDLDDEILNEIKSFNNLNILQGKFDKNIIEEIKNSEKIILVGHIGKTTKKTYIQFKEFCRELNKEIYLEIAI